MKTPTRLTLIISAACTFVATAVHITLFFPLRAALLLIAALGELLTRWGESGESHMDELCKQWRLFMQGSTYDQVKELAEENRVMREQLRLLKTDP